jgi:hypothetical protein
MLHVEVVLCMKYANAPFQNLILHVRFKLLCLQGKEQHSMSIHAYRLHCAVP